MGLPSSSVIVDGGCRPWDPEPVDLDGLLAMLEPPAWHADAACRTSDVSFFPERGVSTHLAAVAVCGGCAVRSECLAALAFRDTEGIWGGTSARERRRLRGADWSAVNLSAEPADRRLG